MLFSLTCKGATKEADDWKSIVNIKLDDAITDDELKALKEIAKKIEPKEKLPGKEYGNKEIPF